LAASNQRHFKGETMTFTIRATRKSDAKVQDFTAMHVTLPLIPCKTKAQALAALKSFDKYNEIWDYKLLTKAPRLKQVNMQLSAELAAVTKERDTLRAALNTIQNIAKGNL
jgi:hypothetical protein